MTLRWNKARAFSLWDLHSSAIDCTAMNIMFLLFSLCSGCWTVSHVCWNSFVNLRWIRPIWTWLIMMFLPGLVSRTLRERGRGQGSPAKPLEIMGRACIYLVLQRCETASKFTFLSVCVYFCCHKFWDIVLLCQVFLSLVQGTNLIQRLINVAYTYDNLAHRWTILTHKSCFIIDWV